MSHEKVRLYHATYKKYVDDIKAGINLGRAAARTDFTRDKQAFYLTDNKKAAEDVLAKELFGFSGDPTAIMTYELELDGLKVHKFSDKLSGPELDEWRKHVGYCRLFVKKNDPVPTPPDTVTAKYDAIIGWMSTVINKKYEPVDSHVWQYALLTENAVKKLKFISAE